MNSQQRKPKKKNNTHSWIWSIKWRFEKSHISDFWFSVYLGFLVAPSSLTHLACSFLYVIIGCCRKSVRLERTLVNHHGLWVYSCRVRERHIGLLKAGCLFYRCVRLAVDKLSEFVVKDAKQTGLLPEEHMEEFKHFPFWFVHQLPEEHRLLSFLARKNGRKYFKMFEKKINRCCESLQWC